ncbi:MULTISPECIES: efflux RND transporter permease subunit [Gammaproteobacteria]|uniref:efflux RND transporter permease subunit n=1 Tax=Gammaproteobacteria TaxID=1236 RepID=UPI000DD0C036|nr:MULTISPECIES: efflux RND transporter permease subunit [Gammaproteobacteria]RTE87097.1 multidrug efflux protein [Aliidiomarina sp. B3213]TCZ93114.1 multidrug efflux protein [Lysobacter sp. N42]
MKFTDIFIRKPVLATVISLLMFLVGLRAMLDLNVRQFPEIQNAAVTVTTAYIGADADLVQGFITTPLEREIAAAEGIDYITSSSSAGMSTIQAFLRLDYDPNDALTQIAAQVNKMRSDLPEDAQEPVVNLSVGQDTAAMYLSFFSDILEGNQITDYLVRVVEPKLATIPGVQRAQILGGETFAMRIWLDSARMAAMNVTGSEVMGALGRNNVLSAVGRTKGQRVAVDVNADTDLRSVEDFEALIVRSDDDAVVRLADIAEIELGAESYNASARYNGQKATFIGIEISPDANALEVIAQVREVWNSEIITQLPEGLHASISYDSTEYIENAIDEVVMTIVLALVIVLAVIYAFLGSLRSVIIPAVAVPLSLVGTFFLMLLLGFSINLLTLLAMVLAIGIVVDDAIIMLENIQRHLEEGMSRMEASIKGARQLAGPIIVMSTTLVAVFVPIGFIGGLTGTLFVEFAFTLAATVILSGVVALTLSPMMCSRMLRSHRDGSQKPKFEQWLDTRFNNLNGRYKRTLHGALETKSVLVLFGILILISCYFLFASSSSELEPQEDLGFVFMISEADSYATLDYVEQNTDQFAALQQDVEEIEMAFVINGMMGSNTAGTGLGLQAWSERERSTQEVLNEDIQPFVDQIPGLQVFAIVPPSLPSPGGGLPVEFVVSSTQPLETLQEVANEIMQDAMSQGRFIMLDTDLSIDRPRETILIDREKASLMGVDMAQLSADVGSLMAGAYAGRFALENRSYRVIPQVQRGERLTAESLKNFYTRNQQGELIPLDTLVSLESSVQPRQLNRFQQLNAVKISGIPRPGVSLGEALNILETSAAEIMPDGVVVDYAGQSRQFKTEGQQLVVTFFFALVIIFLVLAAQFESFKDSIIVLVTVPMSICGALIFVSLGFTSLNIYTQVGLVTLIGLIAKHGILIVEFANQLQEEGKSKREAIEMSASIRLRPILMTTAATVLAMLPLLVASGPGAASRFAMGLIIASGMTIGTLFTLFVVPAIYMVLAKDRTPSDSEVEPAAS